MRLALVVCAVLALSGTAAAATIRVPQDQPTIQDAATAAADGDVISISPGLYKENVTSTQNNVTFTGRGVVIDGNIAGVDGICLTLGGTGNVVKGIAFRNGGIQIQFDGAGGQVSKCTFIDANTNAVFFNGVDDGQVIGCKFLGCGQPAISGGAGTDNLLVQKCQFRQIGSSGVGVTGDGCIVDRCQFLNVDDSDAAAITGATARFTGNKLSGISGDAVQITGADAVVEKNKSVMVNGGVANVDGANALIRFNSGTFIGGGVNVANGTGSEVSSNRIAYTYDGINVTGDGVTVSSNKLTYVLQADAVAVTGDMATIQGNSIGLVVDDSDGISLDLNATGGGLIEGNKVSDTGGNGIIVNSNTVTIRGNTITRCGTEDESGISVVGNDNTIDTNSVTDAENVGFRVNGDGNDFVRCTSKNANADGFRVITGSDACTFAACSATGSGGEGFDNRGTNTDLQSGSFLKNRIDIANDTGGAATITIDPSVNFGTGGDTTLPEVD